MLTQEKAKELFEYIDGELFWKINWSYKARKGKKVGCLKNNGYLGMKINKKDYQVHRVIYLIHHGFMPRFIDHVDCNRSNNKIENLRECSFHQNCWNKKISPLNTSGVKGVYKKRKKWAVQLTAQNKYMYFGTFEDIELAELVAKEARNLYHKEFARHV